MYFVIRDSDGDTTVTCMDQKKLEARLAENYWGSEPQFLTAEDVQSEIFGMDPNYWPEGSLLIIKGEICVPKPVDVVKTYRL